MRDRFLVILDLPLISRNKNRKIDQDSEDKLIGRHLLTSKIFFKDKMQCFAKICTSENSPFYGIIITIIIMIGLVLLVVIPVYVL